MIDTHVHLQDARYADDLDAVLGRAAEAGVEAAIVPGTTLADSEAAIGLARRFGGGRADAGRTDAERVDAEHRAAGTCRLYAAVGVHPTEATGFDAAALARLRSLAGAPGVVAIGEIGLDYYWPKIPDRGWVCAEPEAQRRALTAQLQLASELDLPVIIHDRDAHEDVYGLLKAWTEADPRARGTLHAYAAGPELLDRFLALGLHIGIDGPVTFKKATRVQAVARQVPLSRLLLETDGPYLTPVPHRGKRNEPGYVPLIAAKIAALRETTVAAIGAQTTANAVRLFGLPA